MKITFMINDKHSNNSITELELPEAIENCLIRNNIKLIGDLIPYIKNDSLNHFRGLGIGKERAIKNALFNYELYNSSDPIDFLMTCQKIA